MEKPLGPSELPSAAFPAATAEASNKAWPRGRQPESLEAWPRRNDGTLLPCWKIAVLRDDHASWPGRCLSLAKTNVVSQDTCRETCERDVNCPVWQFSSKNECWQGDGNRCEEGSLSVLGAQRLQHGDVTVLKDMSHLEVINLFKLAPAASDPAQGAASCRNFCYSDIRCEYWQYGSNGCYVDAGWWSHKTVAYPLTSAGASATSKFAATVTAGEYIQHSCPGNPSQSAGAQTVNINQVVVTNEAGASSFWWLWVLVPALLLGGAGAGAIYYFLGIRVNTNTGPRRTRVRLVKKSDPMQAAPPPRVPLVAPVLPVPTSPIQAVATVSTVPTVAPGTGTASYAAMMPGAMNGSSTTYSLASP
eukprot:gnl/TRDRNA2_/TRDRNA2_186953_c0_seq1.p1 gnl/TRDRNA2_/TRDRNA2_186953_c0~~gnl/TRDRNA2_/TRDRNA2_186953_c0_seq1.p1  ORF type:complete len:402 (-),score=51.14 gnl/TRDRNA2_/TRDRNA2_186953_c0_seq1:135-1217(-)